MVGRGEEGREDAERVGAAVRDVDGDAADGRWLEGRVDDFFVINRAASPEEIQAYRERRQYSAMPITTMVTP